MPAVVRTGGEARLVHAPRPRRPIGWARVRVLLAGICRTDLYAASGELPVHEPRILGHELVGEIIELDPVGEGPAEGTALGLVLGQRVTATPLLPCARCPPCRRQLRCASPEMLGVSLDGAFAEEVVLPVGVLHAVPANLALHRAAFVEPLAAALAVQKAPLRPSERGLLLGEGRIAELTTRVLARFGFGDVARATPAALGPEDEGRFDFVIETAATEASLAAALRSVRPGGVVVLKSRPPRAVAIDLARAVTKDVTLAAVGYASFSEAIALAAELPLDDLLGDVYPLERFAAAFARAREETTSPKLFLRPVAGGEL